MAYDFKPVQYDGEFTSLQKKHLKTVLDGMSAGIVSPQANPTELTDSTGGTATNTLAAITAGAAYAQADMTAVKNALASLAAKLTAVQEALKTAGVFTA